ncbi:GldL-related protein [Flavobacterium solisilvae]|uniref:Gliding motility protein GldL-like N-terminal domain-containing protein n=1 Tax=Flavobacterium solisilvae TaxID=1852019 RepID=A0ABX1QS16_9FLAO|nr:hypothetical protein [Flavobacterium solisilvae]NMH24463.1 hypothetical protein [Flavobacterium solisilvae]
MKNKYLIVIFVIGIMYIIFGALFKILHLEIGPITGSVLLTFGMLLEALALILFVIKLIKNKNNDFLNK